MTNGSYHGAGTFLTVVQNEAQVKKNISLAVHISFETSVRYVSETLDEKIWHWDLLEKSAKKRFLCIFGSLFWFWLFLATFFAIFGQKSTDKKRKH